MPAFYRATSLPIHNKGHNGNIGEDPPFETSGSLRFRDGGWEP